MVGDDKYLTVGEVVAKLRAAGYPDTEARVRRLVASGQLEAYQDAPGSHRRIAAASVDELIRRRREGDA